MRSSLQPSATARVLVLAAIAAASLAGQSYVHAQENSTSGSGGTQVSRAVGTIKSIQGDSITLSSDSGGEVTAKLASSTKILRVPPGQKDLKNAVPLQAQDLQPGDRVLVRGQASADPHSIAALAVIVMKQSDVSAKQQQDREDWQKRGVGGLVSTVDASTGTISISSGGFGATKAISIHTSKDTALRRYAPNSVKFDDAKPAPLDQIKPGDQLRARGTRSEDGSQLTAEEVVSGTFVNIAGTVTAIDPAANTMTVQDAIRKGPVVVKVSPDSQMKKLPAEFAQRIAMRLKAANGETGDQASAAQNGGTQGARPPSGAVAPGAGSQFPRGPGGIQGERGNGGPPDLQRFLSRLPNSALADLHKGDAVMIVSTLGGDSGAVTAITLLAGVEPILTAAPNRSASTLLSPWSLGASGGEGEAVAP